MTAKVFEPKHLLLCVALFFQTIGGTAQAQPAAEKARIEQCPEGQYAGPHEGARRFSPDPYVWFVSREFAKRFCMPEQFIDDSLKGALAIAARIKPDDEVNCGMFMGRSDVCPARDQLLLDVYVDNRKANIPKADPSVEFYVRRVWSSGQYFSGVGIGRADRRRKGQITEAPGERPPFSPYTTSAISRKDWTRFFYVGVRDGWATMAWDFIEDHYRANWVDGIDLITLDTHVGLGRLVSPDVKEHPNTYDSAHDKTNPIQRYAVVILAGKDAPTGPGQGSKIPYPSGYLHTIELPHKLAQLIYAADQKRGTAFFGDIKRSMEPARPSAPATQR